MKEYFNIHIPKEFRATKPRWFWWRVRVWGLVVTWLAPQRQARWLTKQLEEAQRLSGYHSQRAKEAWATCSHLQDLELTARVAISKLQQAQDKLQQAQDKLQQVQDKLARYEAEEGISYE